MTKCGITNSLGGRQERALRFLTADEIRGIVEAVLGLNDPDLAGRYTEVRAAGRACHEAFLAHIGAG